MFGRRATCLQTRAEQCQSFVSASQSVVRARQLRSSSSAVEALTAESQRRDRQGESERDDEDLSEQISQISTKREGDLSTHVSTGGNAHPDSHTRNTCQRQSSTIDGENGLSSVALATRSACSLFLQLDNKSNAWWTYVTMGSAVLAALGLAAVIKYR